MTRSPIQSAHRATLAPPACASPLTSEIPLGTPDQPVALRVGMEQNLRRSLGLAEMQEHAL